MLASKMQIHAWVFVKTKLLSSDNRNSTKHHETWLLSHFFCFICSIVMVHESREHDVFACLVASPFLMLYIWHSFIHQSLQDAGSHPLFALLSIFGLWEEDRATESERERQLSSVIRGAYRDLTITYSKTNTHYKWRTRYMWFFSRTFWDQHSKCQSVWCVMYLVKMN